MQLKYIGLLSNGIFDIKMIQIRAVLCITVLICVLCYIEASPLANRQDAKEYKNCKDLCKLCNCVGFYCGDECICECHSKNGESEFSRQ